MTHAPWILLGILAGAVEENPSLLEGIYVTDDRPLGKDP